MIRVALAAAPTAATGAAAQQPRRISVAAPGGRVVLDIWAADAGRLT